MSKKMSLETRVKISEGNKARHQQKLDVRFVATSKSRKLMDKLGEAFSEGHPDGLRVAAIRNYGGFGVERIVEGLGERTHAQLPQHEEKSVENTDSADSRSDK